MLVITCIKQVPDTTQVKIDRLTNTLVRDGIPFIINPYDTHAIEEGLRLNDRFGLRSLALSMGPPNAEAALKKSRARPDRSTILMSWRMTTAPRSSWPWVTARRLPRRSTAT